MADDSLDSLTLQPAVIVHWPLDARYRRQLACRRVPCLWLVEPCTELPTVEPWEDWIRLPADRDEIEARLRTLVERVFKVELVDRLMLRNALGSVVLSGAEAAAVESLLGSPGRLVPRRLLSDAIWPDGEPSIRALDDLMYRLRRRLKPLRLNIYSARSRGFILGVETELVPSALSEALSPYTAHDSVLCCGQQIHSAGRTRHLSPRAS